MPSRSRSKSGASALFGNEPRSLVATSSATVSSAAKNALRRVDEPVPFVQKLEHGGATADVGRIRDQLQAEARPLERYLANRADRRRGPVRQHHDAVGEQHGLLDVVR